MSKRQRQREEVMESATRRAQQAEVRAVDLWGIRKPLGGMVLGLLGVKIVFFVCPSVKKGRVLRRSYLQSRSDNEAKSRGNPGTKLFRCSQIKETVRCRKHEEALSCFS